jgi:hypothetical protein
MSNQVKSSNSDSFTFEQLVELFRETDRQMKETDRQIQETALQMQETDRKIDKVIQETDRQMQETALQMQKTDRQMQETDRKIDRTIQETNRQMKETNKKISALGDRIGELVEVIVQGGIVRMFCALGYSFSGCTRRYEFENKELDISGEIDLFLENGVYALLVEVKTNANINDVKAHIKRVEKFRQYTDAKNDKRKFVAAIGGGLVRKEVMEYAMKNGIYVIIQSGETVKIAELPKGFKARVW